MRILIIEDNHDIAGNVGDYLSLQGHVVDYASDGQMGVNIATQHTFDAIILDINLPRMNGFDVCRELRESHQLATPILMLTARDSLADKIIGFELGALDYLVKPFELQELALRIEALRSKTGSTIDRILTVGEVQLVLEKWQATRQGRELNLHHASLKILAMLMRATPNPVTTEDLEFHLWGDSPPDSSPLRSHLYELRRELDKPFDFKMLHTLRGIGVVLKDDSTEQHDDVD